MAMMEVSILPVGTPTPSVSHYVANAVSILRAEKAVRYELTAMGTIVEGELEHLLTLAGKMHQSAFAAGARRVVTTIKIDDRRDKTLTIEGKLKAVRDKMP